MWNSESTSEHWCFIGRSLNNWYGVVKVLLSIATLLEEVYYVSDME